MVSGPERSGTKAGSFPGKNRAVPRARATRHAMNSFVERALRFRTRIGKFNMSKSSKHRQIQMSSSDLIVVDHDLFRERLTLFIDLLTVGNDEYTMVMRFKRDPFFSNYLGSDDDYYMYLVNYLHFEPVS